MNRKNSIAVAKGPSPLVRARFWPDMLLRHDDMELLSDYPRDLSRLLFRSLFGQGVLCGLAVGLDENGPALTVKAGVALNDSGDPILVPRDQRVDLKDGNPPSDVASLWVVLCATARCASPRAGACQDDDEPTPYTRESHGFEIHVLTAPPDDASPSQASDPPNNNDCRCADPSNSLYEGHYEGLYQPPRGENSDCVLLARLTRDGASWKVDHKVRRFARPVLMRDPLAEDAAAPTPETQGSDA